MGCHYSAVMTTGRGSFCLANARESEAAPARSRRRVEDLATARELL